MSTFAVFSFIILGILGGLIAWAGDVIGYRLGKSRRSLFGLRPRVTARLIGVAVGVALPLVGLGTALLGSRDARDAFLHMDELRQQERALTAQNDQLERQIERARRQVAESQGQARVSERRAIDLRLTLHATNAELGQSRALVSEANTRLSEARRRVEALRTETTSLRAKRTILERVSAGLQDQIAKVQDSLVRLQDALLRGQVQLAAATEQLKSREEEVARKQAEVNALEADYSLIRESALRLQATIQSRVVFESGHELVRAILDVQDSQEAMERALRQLLVAAGEAAEQQGAERGPNTLAVKLIRPWPPEVAPDVMPSESDIISYFATQLRRVTTPKVMVGVRVWRRMYEAERAQARVELWSLPYTRVFAKDEVIYSVSIDGSLSRNEIFTQLWNLVRTLVRREAIERGLLPHPRTREYGSLPAEQLLAALDEIAAQKRPVQVQVVAAKDTYITDALAIRIEVKSE